MNDNISAFETGARKLMPTTDQDPCDAFSQKAAENRKPPRGGGLAENQELERSETDKSDLREKTPADDAKGQSESNHQGGSNNGMSSANPRALSGDEDGDATFHKKA